QELTIPEVAQSIVLTRMSMQSTGMPEGETLSNFAISKTTIAIHLAIRNLREIERQLIPHYGADCPVAVIYRASWPDELVLRGTLSDIRGKVREAKITRTALILVGPALGDVTGFRDSALYDPAAEHILRVKKAAS
ncbi:MAG: SAM-dependent methyltransferase, partial [Pseudomonadota bacterium]